MRNGNRRRRAGMWIAATLTLGIVSLGATAAQQTRGTKIYRGDWFAVAYPREFTVRNGMPGRTTRGPARRYDSAFFKSPGTAVEFYLYSPQWKGDPTDYAVDERRETVVDRKEKTAKDEKRPNDLGVRWRWITVRAKDGSYTRSWVDKENKDEGTRLVFGIKYKDRRSYLKYRRQYEQFKISLEQFADGQ